MVIKFHLLKVRIDFGAPEHKSLRYKPRRLFVDHLILDNDTAQRLRVVDIQPLRLRNYSFSLMYIERWG